MDKYLLLLILVFKEVWPLSWFWVSLSCLLVRFYSMSSALFSGVISEFYTS